MKKAEIILPRKKGSDALFVAVNGENYHILRGVKVSVPLAVKEVIEASERQETNAERFINQMIAGV